MPGSKIPVLEIEKLKITEDGRGLIFVNDGTNLLMSSVSPWSSKAYPHSGTAGAGNTTRACLPCASSLGWLKCHYISSSTYGATGAAVYIPVYRFTNVDTA